MRLSCGGLRLAAGLVCALGSGMGLCQTAPEQNARPGVYQGVSQPPPEPILANTEGQAAVSKPSPAAVSAAAVSEPQPSATGPVESESYAAPAYPHAAPAGPQPLAMRSGGAVADPDGDIVHPGAGRPGELAAGATLRVRLMERISSSESEKGEPFHGQVASDVLEDGKVLIPAGSMIEGRVSAVSSGHFGGHGSFRLKPEAVTLPDGSRYLVHAQTTGTPGSKTRMDSEGTIHAGSRAKKDGVEYGAAVGAGAITGAVLGGPVGALTGSLIGAGAVTTHLMVDHPQATLEPGSVLLFSLTEPMNMLPASN